MSHLLSPLFCRLRTTKRFSITRCRLSFGDFPRDAMRQKPCARYRAGLPLFRSGQSLHLGDRHILGSDVALRTLLDQDFLEDRRILRRSEEQTSELQSLMRISYAVFCLKKKNKNMKTSKL